MLTFVTIIHVLLCVFMIFVILLQPGKDAGMGAALGGGAATTAFGGRGAVTFLTKVTAICAALFFVTSLGLSFVGLKSSVAGAKPTKQGKAIPNATATADAGVNPGSLEQPPTTPVAPSADAGSVVAPATARDAGSK